MIQQNIAPTTLDKVYGGNFKRVTLLYGELEGSNPNGPCQINESDEDGCSENKSRDSKKRSLPPLDMVKQRIVDKYSKKLNHRSPNQKASVQPFDQHIGFRNSFYKNTRYQDQISQGTKYRERINEVRMKEAGLFTKYAQRFKIFGAPAKIY